VKRRFYLKPVRKNSILIIFLSLIVIYSGCSKEKIMEETLVNVYVENVISEETYSANSDSLLAHRQMIFSKYKITEEAFRNEIERYSDDKTKWESFFKKANERLVDLKKSNAIQ
jgi:hypothetical protein